MKEIYEQLESPWAQMLDAFLGPAALLDLEGRYLYLNEASRTDPVLARGRIGERSLDCCRDDGEAWMRAYRRQVYYNQATQERGPLYFAEEVTTRQGDVRSFQWICVPVSVSHDTVTEVAVIGFDITDGSRPVATVEQGVLPATPDPLVQHMAREFRVPLAAMVGMAHTMANELSGVQREQATLIERVGQQLLQQMGRLPDPIRSDGDTPEIVT